MFLTGFFLSREKTRTSDWQMLVWMGGKGDTYTLLVGVQICAATVEIGVMIPQKARHGSTIGSRYITPGHIPKGLYILLQRHLLIHDDCCSINNSQETETT